MVYREFRSGVVSRDEDTGLYSGVVENSADYLKFEAEHFGEIEPAFQKAVDDYIEKCKAIGKDPYTERHKSSFKIHES